MKPLIGITSDLRIANKNGRPWNSSQLLTSYSEAIIAAGGVPVLLPLASPDICETMLHRIDGIILSGGNDIPASVLGESPHPTVNELPMARWESEHLWLTHALALDRPVLGICLGMQVMNVAAGGGMIQDIPDLCPGSLTHGTSSRLDRHEVEILGGSRLAALAPSSRVEITSSHHQAIKNVPAPYRQSATSPDGVIEAIERRDKKFAIGVQWHPERDPRQPDWLLEGFVRHCASVGENATTG